MNNLKISIPLWNAISEQDDLQRPIQTETMTEAWLKTIWRHFPAQKKEGTYVCMSAIYSLATKPQATDFFWQFLAVPIFYLYQIHE